MKSRIWITLIVLLVVVCLSIPGLAAAENRGFRDHGRCAANNFADQNDDGICDKRTRQDCDGKNTCNQGNNFVDQDNDGVCDNKENGAGQNFVDEDNDGVCDNRNQQNGCGAGRQNRCRKGKN